MSQDTQQDHISKKRVVYTMPGVDAVTVRRDEEYRVTDAGALTMDLYYPPDAKSGARTPAVIFVTGFSDVGAQRMLGCKLKEMALKCAVLCYGYTLDSDGSTGVADAARHWGFVTPCAGTSVEDLPRDIPLFVARAGQDQMPGLNETLDRFLTRALACNLPVTFVNHSTAPHAFDLFHDSETSREIVRRILAFLQFHLLHSAIAIANRSADQ